MTQHALQVSQSVTGAIRSRIGRGEWAVGQRLPSITKLAQEFGVSTGSAREAVKALATQGMLSVQHGRGIFVVALSPQVNPYAQFQNARTGSILELCEARRILEPELAALAAERGTDDELQIIHDQAIAMERRVATGEDFLDPDLQFHRQIALAAHNSVLAQMLEGVSDLLLESRTITASMPDLVQRAVRYHVLIADTLVNRNAVQVRLLMQAHVNDAITSVLQWQGDGKQIDQLPAQSSAGHAVVCLRPSLTSGR